MSKALTQRLIFVSYSLVFVFKASLRKGLMHLGLKTVTPNIDVTNHIAAFGVLFCGKMQLSLRN